MGIWIIDGCGAALVGLRLELERIFLEELVAAELGQPFGVVGLGRMGSGVEKCIVVRQHKLAERKDFAIVVMELVAFVSGLELVEEHTLVVAVDFKQLVFAEQIVFELVLIVENIS